MRNKDLPPGQTHILTCFADAEDEGRQASRAEIAEFCGYAFPSAVSKHVDALVRKGYLLHDREKKRNIKVSEDGWAILNRTPAFLGVPILGAIAAGTPILSSENLNGYLDEVNAKPGRIALQVRGDSMIEAGINDGDFAIIDTASDAESGTIAAVMVDEEATLKVIRKQRGPSSLSRAISSLNHVSSVKTKLPKEWFPSSAPWHLPFAAILPNIHSLHLVTLPTFDTESTTP